MRTLILLPLILILALPGHSQNTTASDEGSSLTVLGFKWSKSRQAAEKLPPPNPGPAAAITPTDKNVGRAMRENDPAGVRDPKADTIDGRREALEKSVQESRAPKPVDGFAYRVKVRNASTKMIEVMFWEYQFIDPSDPKIVARRQFLCGVKIKPDKEKEVQSFSVSGPSDVLSVESLANKSGNHFQEKVVINRVEYADGTIWQRKDWNFAEVKAGIARAIATPWGTEMCRSL